MGCSLESYRIRIGTFGNSFKGNKITKVSPLRRGKNKKGQSFAMLLFLGWCALSIVCAPILHQAKFVQTNSSQCDSTIQPVGMKPGTSSHPPNCISGSQPGGRTPGSPSLPSSCVRGIQPGGRTPGKQINSLTKKDQHCLLSKLPYLLSSKVINKKAHILNGNQASQGKAITLCYWNKGSSYLSNKQEDISEIINTHKPLVMGLGEAQMKREQNLADVQQPGFTLHLDTCQDTLGVSRCAVYTHNSLVVKRRDDLEDNEIATVWLQLGLPHQKGILVMCGYRQWRLPGQPDGGAASGSIPAQRQRWNKILSQWEKALSEDREVILDANIDVLTWNCEDLPASHTNMKLKPLIRDLFEKILPHGVTQLIQVPTHAQFGMATKCLDHLYTTNPEKLSQPVVEFTGLSDHKLIKVQRFSKTLKECPRYVRKRCFKKFKKEEFKQRVSQMPELVLIAESNCANQAAEFLTAGL